MDLPPLLEEEDESQESSPDSSVFVDGHDLSPIPESEGERTPDGYFRAYGIGISAKSNQGRVSQTPVEGRRGSRETDSELSRPRSPVPDRASSDEVDDSGKVPQVEITIVSQTPDKTVGTPESERSKSVKNTEEIVKKSVRIDIPEENGDEERADSGYSAELSPGIPRKLVRELPDSRGSDGRASAELAAVSTGGSDSPDDDRSWDTLDRRTPLIVANIGVMQLEDTEVNLSNALALPSIKQGPHFMTGRMPTPPEPRRKDQKDELRLPRLKKRFLTFDGRDGRVGYISPLKDKSMDPMARFRRAARLVQLILTAITSTRRENQRREAKLMSFYQLQDDIGTRKGVYGDGLDFDPTYYKACKQIQISDIAKQILNMDPNDRSDEQRHVALVSLNQAVEAFGEFPIKMQQSLVKRGWYEHFETKRVIIRQGHYAENFYFILSGTAVVTILTTNKKTGETFNNTVAFLKKGNSFGELALMYGGTRNATVTCKDDVELLAVGRDDFVDIFMHVDKDVEPEHIQFLRLVEHFDGWPIPELPYADPKICLFTYFRRGVVMCRDSNTSEWIYVIKTGTCRVLKALQPVKADMQTIPSDLRSSTTSLQSTPTNSPRKNKINSSMTSLPTNRNEAQKMSHDQKYLPPLKRQNQDAVQESRKQHREKIEKLYEERHNKPAQKKAEEAKLKAKPKPNAKVYVQIQKLGPKDTFGLSSVAFQMIETPMSLILVSDGAECVLINKKFFLQYLTEKHHKVLRKSIQPYPSEESLQQKLQDQVNWDAYKAVTFQKEILYNKKLHDTLLL